MGQGRTRRAALAAVAGALAALMLLAAVAEARLSYRATIRYTENGVPHILADNWRGIGYGYGYAVARENICTLADAYVTVSAERSRFFGPERSWRFHGNSTTQNNLNSDFFFQRIIDRRIVENLVRQAAPQGPRREVRQLVNGYVRGYNRYLERVGGPDGVRDPRCRGEEWVRPITAMDAYRRFYAVDMLASGALAIDGIGGAQPPAGGSSGGGGSSAEPAVPDASGFAELAERLSLGGLGSNAYALGKDATKSGAGMVLGNPHFPWDGGERFYQAHLTIPGKLDVAGATLIGAPLVVIGHNRGLAWTHTVSPAFRFTPFEERLVPGDPTSYLYDGEARKMEADRVTVQVPDGEGGLEPRTRTLYSTHHGPVMTSILGLPVFPWTAETAFTMGDANGRQFRLLNHFFEADLAQTVDELHDAIRRNQGVPWVHTIAADSRGRAFYADISVVPHVTDEKAADCNTALGTAGFAALRLPVLDGSRSACEWGTDPDAIQEGIFGPSSLPHLFRDDYVSNSNDSYWLSNPAERLEGFPRIVGNERNERSLRTRMGLKMIEERLAGTDGMEGTRFSLSDLRRVMFNNRNLSGELARDDVAAFCEANPVVQTQEGPVDVSAACPVLRAWDLRDSLDSKGAILWRRFADRLLAPPGNLPGENAVGGGPTPAGLWRTPYSNDDPVHTPRDLNTTLPQVANNLGLAVRDLRGAEIALDAAPGDAVFEARGEERIAIHGGPGRIGIFNNITNPWVPGEGYPDVIHGSSFVMAAEMRRRGCPRVSTLVAYSQASDPASPYFADQTRRYSRRHWVRERFCERDILRSRSLRITRLNRGARVEKRCRGRRSGGTTCRPRRR